MLAAGGKGAGGFRVPGSGSAAKHLAARALGTGATRGEKSVQGGEQNGPLKEGGAGCYYPLGICEVGVGTCPAGFSPSGNTVPGSGRAVTESIPPPGTGVRSARRKQSPQVLPGRVTIFAVCLLSLWACIDSTALLLTEPVFLSSPYQSSTLRQDGNDEDLPYLKGDQARMKALEESAAGKLPTPSLPGSHPETLCSPFLHLCLDLPVLPGGQRSHRPGNGLPLLC